jgi:hypothetical protein
VNGRDVSIVARALFTSAGHRRWDPVADLNRDGFVGLLDLLAVLFAHFDPRCR